MPMWNPWRGCKRCSEGCLHCYIHKGDAKRGVDTSMIVKTKDFDKPIAQLKKGGYKMKPGLVYLGFSTDFLIEEADAWRGECWKMIKERSDCTFLFLTKRIERFAQCIPEDWADGYENVTVCCTIENQRNADKKLSVFQTLPIKHKCITAQPLIERVNLEPYLDGVELVVVGGESDKEAHGRLTMTGCLTFVSSASGSRSILSSVSAERTLSRMAGSISSRREICVGRHVWLISTTNASRKGVFK